MGADTAETPEKTADGLPGAQVQRAPGRSDEVARADPRPPTGNSGGPGDTAASESGCAPVDRSAGEPDGRQADRSFGPTALVTPANAITIARIGGTAVLVVLLVAGRWWPAWGLFVVLALSDVLDGYLARRGGTTRSGAFLDPLADKFLAGATLVTLAAKAIVWWVPVAVILAREVAIFFFRSYAVKRGAAVPASLLGKLKTLVTLVAIAFLIVPSTEVREAGVVLLWAGVAATVISGLDYLVRAQSLIRAGQGADAG